MKKLILFFFFGLLFQFSQSQNYIPFPNDTAKWDCVFLENAGPAYGASAENYNFNMKGDTILKGSSYKKIYSATMYIGGLREDSLKQIFFFPFSTEIIIASIYDFPNDTTEQLFYTFNNLSIGTIIPINSRSIEVAGIDSVLIGSTYHKRYMINNCLGNEYWIEGIGSTADLLSPFTSEFEWILYTLCYEDSMTYLINPVINPAPPMWGTYYDSCSCCFYSLNVGINNKTTQSFYFTISPNPVTDNLQIQTDVPIKNIEITDITGRLLYTTTSKTINCSSFAKGVYFITLTTEDGKAVKKFVKE